MSIGDNSLVEVRPEVVFLYELLEELTSGRLRIPRFQRPFVWRRDQMTDLLDSVYKQYPIGNLLVWETDTPVATLDRLGPIRFPPPETTRYPIGYVLDGHQRLATLAGALVTHEKREVSPPADEDMDRWNISWNMVNQRFQHGHADLQPDVLFPLPALLDTVQFFSAVARTRRSLTQARASLADDYTAQVSEIARAFQYYRVPVVRMRQTRLTEAVEIFARLNSKGQAMTADQMVSALMYRQGQKGSQFDLAVEIDALSETLSERGFGDVDRTTILRAILANLDEDIYRTDWTRLAGTRREELLSKLKVGVQRTSISLELAVDFLQEIGVTVGRLLPYAMQLVVLSAFFDANSNPSDGHLSILRRWFWVSSFSGWFGGANPSRVNSLVAEFREKARRPASTHLENFDLDAQSLPFPASFDMRSARTRALLLVMLDLEPMAADGSVIEEPARRISERGPAAVGHIFGEIPKGIAGNPANRMIRPPGALRGPLRSWLQAVPEDRIDVLQSHGVDEFAARALKEANVDAFVRARQNFLIEAEYRFQSRVGVRLSVVAMAPAPVDTE